MKKIFKYIVFVLVLVSFANAGVPTVTIDDNVSDDVTNQDITFTFTFSEGVDNFTKDDIDVTNGTKGDFTGENNDTNFTLVVTPNANFEGTITVDVNESVCDSNSTGDGNKAATQATQDIDTKSPSITSISLSDVNLSIGETATLTVVFSEAVNNFDVSDVNLSNSNGTLSDFSTADNITFTSTFTPDENIEDNNNTIAVEISDIVDIAGNSLSDSNSSDIYTIDTYLANPHIPDLNASSDSVGENGTNDDNLTNDNTPLIVGLNDYNETVTISLIDLSDNNNLLGIVPDLANGDDWELNSSNLSDGLHNIVIRIEDKAGNIKQSGILPITVDTSAVISVDQVDDGILNKNDVENDYNITGTTNNIEVGQTVTIDIGSKECQTTVQDDRTFYCTISSDDWKDLSDNTYSGITYDINATVQDKAGNIANDFNTRIQIDTNISTPNIPDLNPNSDSGQYDDDNLTNNNTPDINGTNSYGEPVNLTLYDENNNNLGTQYIPAGSDWNMNISQLSDGEHNITAKIIDLAGNESPLSDPLTIIIDTQATIVLDTNISGDNKYINADEQTQDLIITGTTTNVEENQTITLGFNGNTYDVNSTNDGVFSITVPSADLNVSDGTYSFDVNVTDVAGNYVQDGIDIIVDTSAHVDIDPITGDSLINQAELDSGIIITGGTDLENGRVISLDFNGVEYNTTAQDGNYSIEINSTVLKDLDETTYLVQTTAGMSDEAGNIAPVTERNVTIDKYSSDYATAVEIDLDSNISTNIYPYAQDIGIDTDLFKIVIPTRGYFEANTSNNDTNISIIYFNNENIIGGEVQEVASILDKGVYFVKVVGKDVSMSGDYNLTTKFTPYQLEIDKKANPKLETIFTNTNTDDIYDINESNRYIKINNGGTSYYDILDDKNISIVNLNFATTPKVKQTVHNGYNYIAVDDYIEKYIEVNGTRLSKYRVNDFYINNDTLYTISYVDGLNIYDISNDSDIKLISHNTNFSGNVILANDRNVYIRGTNGLIVVNIHQDYKDEANTTLDLASLPLNSTVQANNYAGRVDTDIFKIILDRSGDLNITSSNVASGNELNITIAKDINFTNIIQDTVGFNNTTISKSLAGGSYFVKIQGNENIVDGTYSLTNSFTTTDEQIDKVRNYQQSANDFEAVGDIEVNGTLISDNDIDLYKFEIVQSSIVELNVSNSNSIDIVQFDINNSDDFATERNITNRYLTSGIYYLKVKGNQGNYTINANFTKVADTQTYLTDRYSDFTVDSDISYFNVSKANGQIYIITNSNKLSVYDVKTKQLLNITPLDPYSRAYSSFDINGSELSAVYDDNGTKKVIKYDISDSLINPTVIPNSIVNSDDINNNKTTITIQGRTYSVGVNGLSLNNNDVMVQDDNISATSIVNIDNNLYMGTQSHGIYVFDITDLDVPKYIRVIPYIKYASSVQSFGTTLYVAYGDTMGIVDVSNDYSNYKVGATTIYEDKNISGVLPMDDVDYFQIMLNYTGELNITLDNNDTNCTLFKEDNDTSLSCNSVQSGGRYFIRLQNIDNSKYTPYSFIVSQAKDDHTDTLSYNSTEAIQSVTVDDNISGNISTTEDVDYFKITLDGKYNLSIDDLTNGFDAAIYYEGGAIVSQNSDGNYSIEKAGDYYIKISNSSNIGDYSFNISLQQVYESPFIDSSDALNKQVSVVTTNGDVNAVYSYGEYLYAIDSNDGFIIVDVNDTLKPTIINKYQTFGTPLNMKIKGTYAYISEGGSGLEILDISNKDNIRFVSRYDTNGTVLNIAIDDNNSKLYIADDANGLVKVDISDISNPTFDKVIDSNITKDVVIYNNLVYATDHTNGIKVFDTTVANNEKTNLEVNVINADRLLLNADKLYVSLADALQIYQLSNTSTTLLGDYNSNINNIKQIKLIKNDYIYAMSSDSNIYILNIKNPAQITLDSNIQALLFDISDSAKNLYYAKHNAISIVKAYPDYSDIFKTAKQIDYSSTIKGNIDSKSDKDIFVFDTDYTGQLSILSEVMTVDGKMSIYDSSAVGMAVAMQETDTANIKWSTLPTVAVVDNNNSNDINTTITLNAGKFYLVLEDGAANEGGNYQFKLDFNTTNDKYMDIIKDGVTNFISTNGGIIKDSLFIGGNDIDYIDINITQRSVLTFTNKGDIIPKISLHYADGTLMNQSTDENATTFTTEISPGIYKVKIEGFTNIQEGDYEIVLSIKDVDDVVIDNGLSKDNIDKIVDIKYLGNYIYVLTSHGIAKYTHLLEKRSDFDTDFITNDVNLSNNTNYRLFAYNDLSSKDKILNYVITTELNHLNPIVSTLTMDTLETDLSYTQEKVAGSSILPYLDVKYISYNKNLYMYDGSTLQLRKIDETNNATMKSYPIGNLKNIEVISNTDGTDTVYMTSNNNGGYLSVLDIATDLTITVRPTVQLGDNISSLFINKADRLLFVGYNNKLDIYDISDSSNVILKGSYSFVGKEFEGTPSSIYQKDSRIYVIVPAKGIVVFDMDSQYKITLATTILNLGEYIDDVFSADHRTVNYTTVENGEKRLKVYFFEKTFSDGENDSILNGNKETPSEGCFIATAAYGSYFQPYVKVLRDFRDNVLLTNTIGKEFVHLYYKYSPPIARSIAHNELAKLVVRVILTPIVYVIKYPLYSLLLVLLFGIARFEYLKRKGVLV